MEGGSMTLNPRSVDEVFKDFKGRRSGMLKALTTDVEEFYLQCDPGEGFTLSSEKVCPKDDFTVTFVTGLESHCVCIVIALTVVRFASIHKMIENWPY
uniref:Alfin N-terminal domain-containing protein n=1 Tax=Physcomitrium patens TaxID=3218 RepID=A0A7I4A9F7_PHYPA